MSKKNLRKIKKQFFFLEEKDMLSRIYTVTYLSQAIWTEAKHVQLKILKYLIGTIFSTKIYISSNQLMYKS